MVRARFKPVPPDQRIRELRNEFKTFSKDAGAPDRVARLAAFTRAAHDERQLNMAMHTAQLCLDEDPDAPAALVAAYTSNPTDPEHRLRELSDLDDLARYVSRDDIREFCRTEIRTTALDWVRDAGEAERRHRLRTLASMFDRGFADDVRDAVS
jgi:hypothetical protein